MEWMNSKMQSLDPNYERKKLWRENNREKDRESKRKWRLNHPKQHRESNRISRLNNLEKERECKRKSAKIHKETSIKNKKNWLLNPQNKEKIKVENHINHNKDKFPLAELCETCPDDDLQPATQRHHFSYEFPELYVSCCCSCHYYLNRSTEEGEDGF